MNLIGTVIKKSALDLWDEMLYLMIFNIICLIGLLLIIPWPFVVFGLYALAYDVGEGRGIKLSTFFNHARRLWKPAYIWGGINLGLLILLGANLIFYGNFNTQWGVIAQLAMVALLIFWTTLQLVALPFYPRLIEPSFKLAMRNAAVVIGKYPIVVFVLLVIIALVWALTLIFPPIVFLATFAITAVTGNRLVGAIVAREQEAEMGATNK